METYNLGHLLHRPREPIRIYLEFQIEEVLLRRELSFEGQSENLGELGDDRWQGLSAHPKTEESINIWLDCLLEIIAKDVGSLLEHLGEDPLGEAKGHQELNEGLDGGADAHAKEEGVLGDHGSDVPGPEADADEVADGGAHGALGLEA